MGNMLQPEIGRITINRARNGWTVHHDPNDPGSRPFVFLSWQDVITHMITIGVVETREEPDANRSSPDDVPCHDPVESPDMYLKELTVHVQGGTPGTLTEVSADMNIVLSGELAKRVCVEGRRPSEQFKIMAEAVERRPWRGPDETKSDADPEQ